jgi:hypothetical protein
MDFKKVVVTNSGKNLVDLNDGFVLYGSLLKGDNQGGLLGGGTSIEILSNHGIEASAYTNFEFLDALYLDLQVFKNYLEFKEPKIRINHYEQR